MYITKYKSHFIGVEYVVQLRPVCLISKSKSKFVDFMSSFKSLLPVYHKGLGLRRFRLAGSVCFSYSEQIFKPFPLFYTVLDYFYLLGLLE